MEAIDENVKEADIFIDITTGEVLQFLITEKMSISSEAIERSLTIFNKLCPHTWVNFDEKKSIIFISTEKLDNMTILGIPGWRPVCLGKDPQCSIWIKIGESKCVFSALLVHAFYYKFMINCEKNIK